MHKVNRKIEYALMALKFMSGKMPGQLTQVKEICEKTGSPFDATARVMQQMVHAEVLKSVQGAYGGYLIVKDLSKVSFYDLAKIVLGKIELAKCLHGDHKCELAGSCNIVAPMNEFNNKLMGFYKTLTLVELLVPSSVDKTKSVDASLNSQVGGAHEF